MLTLHPAPPKDRRVPPRWVQWRLGRVSRLGGADAGMDDCTGQ
jgi:hypothetical protein